MYRNFLTAALVALFVLSGCTMSGGSPVLPESTDNSANYSAGNAPVCWGIWDVSIDPESATYEVTPVRGSQFVANVTMFLQPPAGSLNNFKLQDMVVSFDTYPGYILIDVDVGLQHPFPGLDMYTGFDVRGIFMQDWQYKSNSDPGVMYGGAETARQLNPDGYTRWMNAPEFTTPGLLGFTPGGAGSPGYKPLATLNPYKYYADGLDAGVNVKDFFVEENNIADRGCFKPGNVNYRHYSLLWPDGPLDFQYAVIASYVEPTVNPPENIPDDFPMEANVDEAFHLEISDNGSTAYYVSPSEKGGDLHLNLEVFDWGCLAHMSTVTGEIGEIAIESPGPLIPSPVLLDPSMLVAGPGTGVSSVYEIDIPGVEPDGLDDQMILVRVSSSVPDIYDYGLGGAVPDGILASYNLVEVPILDEPAGDPPVAVAEACSCLWVVPGESVTFDGNQSYSPNGLITCWDWDFDGDGTFCDPYDSGTDDHPTYVYNSAGDYYVDLRVTDEAGLTDTLDESEKLHVHVGTWTPPTAVSRISPTIGFIDFAGEFEGNDSTGTINLYEWDFEGDCIWDYESETDGNTTHAFTVPGYYDSTLRVTGTGCDTEITQVRMIDPLGIIGNGNFWDGLWGDWTHGHGGTPSATYIEEIIPQDTFRHIVHFHRSGTSDGGVTWIYQDLGDYDVSSLDELYLNLFLNIDHSTLYGDGWMGGEMDIAVHVVYDDGTGMSPYWRQAWFGWDGEFDGQWQWDTAWLPWYVTTHSQEQVTEDTWHEKKTLDLMSIDPPPETLKWIRIGSYGWGWDTYVGPVWFSEE